MKTIGRMLFFLSLTTLLYSSEKLTLNLSKNSAYTNGIIQAVLVLSYDRNDPVIKSNLDELKLDGFWVKELEKKEKIEIKDTVYEKFYFLISPQSSGIKQIPPQTLAIAKREPKIGRILWSKLETKNRTILVHPLPINIDIQGSYTLESSLKQTHSRANKPIDLTITIKGYGNLDDIKPFALQLKKQTVFSDKPIVKARYKNGKYRGVFTQNFSILADKSFTIPAISFKYFNTHIKLTQKLHTKPIHIDIQEDFYKKYIHYAYIAIGFLLGYLFFYITNKFRFKKQNITLRKRIKKAKSDKELYFILIHLKEHKAFNDEILLLEQNIYKGIKNKVSKQKILKKLASLPI